MWGEMKEKYEAQAGEIRKNISVAKAEMERYKTNKKLTKRKERKMEQSYYKFANGYPLRRL